MAKLDCITDPYANETETESEHIARIEQRARELSVSQAVSWARECVTYAEASVCDSMRELPGVPEEQRTIGAPARAEVRRLIDRADRTARWTERARRLNDGRPASAASAEAMHGQVALAVADCYRAMVVARTHRPFGARGVLLARAPRAEVQA